MKCSNPYCKDGKVCREGYGPGATCRVCDGSGVEVPKARPAIPESDLTAHTGSLAAALFPSDKKRDELPALVRALVNNFPLAAIIREISAQIGANSMAALSLVGRPDQSAKSGLDRDRVAAADHPEENCPYIDATPPPQVTDRMVEVACDTYCKAAWQEGMASPEYAQREVYLPRWMRAALLAAMAEKGEG